MPATIIIGGLANAQEATEATPLVDIRARLFNLINSPFQPESDVNHSNANPDMKELFYTAEGKGDSLVSDWYLIEKTSNYALNLVNSTNIVLFDYFDKEQKEAKRKALLMAYYYLYAQWELQRLYGRRYKLATYEESLKTCASQIRRLNQLMDNSKPSPALELELEIDPIEGHTHYLGTDLALWIRDSLYELLQGKVTITIKDLIRMINERRLYWVWGGGIIEAVADVIPQSLKGLDHTRQSLTNISTVTGYLSFILYYFRFSMELLVLASHVIENRWMTQEELALDATTWEKFVYHGKQRFFTLVNDGIWATANLLCFMVLVGSQIKKNANNFVTLGLLAMDVCLLFWQYHIELQRHRDYINQLRNEYDAASDDTEKERLNQMISDAEFEWKYQQLHMINDLGYAIALMLSFSIVCVADYPVQSLHILGVVGAGLCFSLNLLNVVIRGWIEIKKVRESKATIETRTARLLSDFSNAADNINLQKQLFLEIKELKATTAHQRQEICYQKIELIRASLFDVIFPSAVMVSLLFLPTGAGIGVIAAVMVLGLLSNLLMTRIIQPYLYGDGVEANLVFNEEEFELFKDEHSFLNTAPSPKLLVIQHSFFSNGYDTEEEGLDDPQENQPIN